MELNVRADQDRTELLSRTQTLGWYEPKIGQKVTVEAS